MFLRCGDLGPAGGKGGGGSDPHHREYIRSIPRQVPLFVLRLRATTPLKATPNAFLAHPHKYMTRVACILTLQMRQNVCTCTRVWFDISITQMTTQPSCWGAGAHHANRHTAHAARGRFARDFFLPALRWEVSVKKQGEVAVSSV